MILTLSILEVFLTILTFECVYSQSEQEKKGACDVGITSKNYPNPRRDDKVQDTYGNGIKVPDPYRWMEDLKSEETKAFIQAEKDLTKAYLEKSPYRAELTARYTELYNHPKYSALFQKGKKFFSIQNTGLQNQDVLYIHDSYTDEGKVFLDANIPNKDGTVSLSDTSFSYDGLIMAYKINMNGSDGKIVNFKNVEKGDIYKDRLTNVKFSELSWTHDNKGLFYAAYPDGPEKDSNKNHKLYYHVLGTDQSKDVMVVEFPDHPDYVITAVVSHCGKYLVVMASENFQDNVVYIVDLEKIQYKITTKLELKPIVTKIEANYAYLTNNENTFIFQTDKDTDNYKLIAIDISSPDPIKSARDFVAENKKDKLEYAYAVHDKYMVLSYTQDVKTVLYLHDVITGKMIKKFPLDIGAVEFGGFFGDKNTPHIFMNFVSFLTPGIIYHCDLSKPSFDLEIVREIKVKNFNRENYETEQVFYNSKDGTKIPMFMVHKKDLQKCGNNLVFLKAYGSTGISNLPYFAVNRLVIISNCNGIHAFANVRGGGEYGQLWHRAGQLDKKQNSFDDFQAAAEYLIKEKYTNNKLLVINGAAHGGLVVGASLNQRPDLFGVAIADSGVFDMLRYDKFSIGRTWVTEFGSSSNPKDFEYLYKYSPLQNVKIPDDLNKQYPAVMLTTAEQDETVPSMHSLKFIATLQYQAKNHTNQKNPFIIRIDKFGIDDDLPLDKEIAQIVDMLSFILKITGVKFQSCTS